MKISDKVMEDLGDVEKKLGIQFDRVWGYLPPTPERDAILINILTAKKLLHEFREENKNG